jgi:hypothetical protein
VGSRNARRPAIASTLHEFKVVGGSTPALALCPPTREHPKNDRKENTMELRAGSRLKSTTCDTEVIAVKAPAGDVDVRCGGLPMVEASVDASEKSAALDGFAEPTQMGKRYVDADDTLEVLCTKPGTSSLSVGDVPLELKESKPLPASD